MVLDSKEIKDGEIYAGAIINPDGTGNHIILLDGELKNSDWKNAMAWAKEKGGDLPTRVEQALFFEKLKNHFKERAYWSNTQHASCSDYAWYQYFGYGNQSYWGKASALHARAVRRILVIQ